jgi:hypothetical protein
VAVWRYTVLLVCCLGPFVARPARCRWESKLSLIGWVQVESATSVALPRALTEIGPVEIEVPRDRDSSFEPVIVKKRQRRLDGIDEIVLSLTALGLTTGEVAAHFDEVFGAKVSRARSRGSPTRCSRR